MNTTIDTIARGVKAGRPQAELIREMKDRGLTILEAIKTAREAFGISLGEAKSLVCSHPAWKGIAVAGAPLHEEIIKTFEDAEAAPK